MRTELASQFPQWEETEKGPEKEKGHPHEGPRRAGSPSPQAQVCARQKGSPTPTPVVDYRCFQNLGRMFGFPIGNVFTFISPTGSPLDLVSSRVPSDGSPTISGEKGHECAHRCSLSCPVIKAKAANVECPLCARVLTEPANWSRICPSASPFLGLRGRMKGTARWLSR